MFENIQNSFNGMFGKIAPGMCRLTMNGNIAVKCNNGYKSYNVAKGTLTNVTNFCFNIGDEMFFVIPTNKVEVGELLSALNKYKRGRATKEDVITEIADVQIMCEQLAFVFGEEEVEHEHERKLIRLQQRIDNHKSK